LLLPEIFKKWPAQTVATSKWLNSQGISRQLTAKYCHSGWLEKISHGCYKRANDKIDWKGAVYALQAQLGLNIIPSAYTSLHLQGYRHQVNVKGQNVYLLGSPKTGLPRWFIKGDWQAKILYKTSSLFPPQLALCAYDVGSHFSIQVCSPERAILEVMDEISSEHAFEDASNIMSGLLDLKSDVVLNLLKKCRSNKVKRIFMFLANYHDLPVFSKIKKHKINTGKGVIQVISKGKYDKEYSITVPSSFGKQESLF
jgi:hypothetical protein